jgi:hypothetical protein
MPARPVRWRQLRRDQPPRAANGRIALAVDVSHWLRPDAACSPERLFCHTYARGKGQAQMIPGWPYSFVDTTRYGHAQVRAWDRLHPRLTHRGPWLDHEGDLPLVEGTLIRLQVEHVEIVDLLWQAFLRRFDLEHIFRLFKQTLGWTRPTLRAPESADRWTWLLLTVHTQLRLARPLVEDCRRPWEKRVTEPRRLTPARVRRGFATSTRQPPTQQPHRNPPDPVPDAHAARPTATQQPVTKSAKPSNATSPSNSTATTPVKQQGAP